MCRTVGVEGRGDEFLPGAKGGGERKREGEVAVADDQDALRRRVVPQPLDRLLILPRLHGDRHQLHHRHRRLTSPQKTRPELRAVCVAKRLDWRPVGLEPNGPARAEGFLN